ncbi:TetR/AcrR family transcriptional regulator [Brevibacillus nitrificans]|uniref:TetR/AcrR family transcriptional regulator n=1 Tax=Brevibacillus nitrificans TaxID=651560 RepID=UPI002E21F2CD|nr:TetR/AcrR family transcriptional regulator [Brevibacillus nitrificans]
MARNKEFDERAALDAAMQVFWEKGYEATSLSDLTARMGIQRTSLYATFGDKQALFLACLEKYSEATMAYYQAKLQKETTIREAIRSCFTDIIASAYDAKPNRGCFSINTMVELAPHDPEFARITRHNQTQLQELFQQAIERGMETGELAEKLDAAAVSRSLVVYLAGLLVTLKSKPERAFVEDSVSTFLQLLK